MSLGLGDFISEALTQIIRGIDKAKADLGDRGDWVSPPIHTIGKGSTIHDSDLRVHYRGGTAKANLVRFDVAVHAGTTTEGGGKGGVNLQVVSAEIGGKVQTEDKAISRIQFEIPLVITDYEEINKQAEDKKGQGKGGFHG